MISKLLDGMTAEEINAKCAGNTCGMKGTSCADQLAKAMVSEQKDAIIFAAEIIAEKKTVFC